MFKSDGNSNVCPTMRDFIKSKICKLPTVQYFTKSRIRKVPIKHDFTKSKIQKVPTMWDFTKSKTCQVSTMQTWPNPKYVKYRRCGTLPDLKYEVRWVTTERDFTKSEIFRVSSMQYSFLKFLSTKISSKFKLFLYVFLTIINLVPFNNLLIEFQFLKKQRANSNETSILIYFSWIYFFSSYKIITGKVDF